MTHVSGLCNQKVSAPAILVRSEQPETNQSQMSVGTVKSMGSSEGSSSVKTLTDSDSLTTLEQQHSPNPAGAAAATGGGGGESLYVRHTTSGSVDSEGFHSMTGEDTEMEQDWMAWSKEVSYFLVMVMSVEVVHASPVNASPSQ